MVLTTSDRKIIDTELETAIEDRADLITCNNYNTVLSVKDHGRGDIRFTVKMCTVCLRPQLAHQDPWDSTCSRSTDAITRNLSYEMIEAFNEAKAFKHIAQWVVPTSDTAADSRNTKEGKFPLISLYKAGSTKKQVNQFLDLINALKTADKTAISNRVTSKFKENKTDPDILDQAIQWL